MISVVFGLLVSTALILLLPPALYSILDDPGIARARHEAAAGGEASA